MDRRQYCDTVTGQLRCRWEAPAVRQELYDHIQDHQAALMAEGMGREEAEEAAVAAMGDPEELGKALDALHSPWPWRVYLLCARCCKAALVLAVGVPTVVEASTLVMDLLGGEDAAELPGAELFVTPREVDSRVADLARVIGYGVSLALNPKLTVEELTMLVE